MIVPSIDLMGGQTVQLVGGRDLEIEAGDPHPIAKKFHIAGEIAVIDLDAALNQGSNAELIKALIKGGPVRVGGGIRDAATAINWLDAGAEKVILGTRAVPEVLQELPSERVVAALDAVHGEVVVDGWRTKTGVQIAARMAELHPYVGEFMVTFVEREGQLTGIDLAFVEQLVQAAAGRRLTVAGGISSIEEIAACDRMGVDCQVGMALYKNQIHLADAIAAPLTSDRPDGLWPTVVCDQRGIALGLCYSNQESLREAVQSRRGIYHSRSRGLWVKGESSGATQELLRVELDCDRDTLRFIVRQAGAGFCHLQTHSCWGNDRGISRLERAIEDRLIQAPAGSYTRRLVDDQNLLNQKLLEEAQELTEAIDRDDVLWEAADVLYFTLVKMKQAGVHLADVEQELDRRSRKISRRPGDAKVGKSPDVETN